MKARILFFSALVMTLGLVSCDKDDKDEDGDGGTQKELILGTWDIYEVNYIDYEDGEKVDEGTEQEDMTLELKANNTFILVEEGESETGSYIVSDGKIIFTYAVSEAPDEMEIVKLDASDFHFKADYEETHEGVVYRDVEIYKATRK